MFTVGAVAIGAETVIATLVAVLYSLQSEYHGGEGGLGWLFGTVFALVLVAVISVIAGLAGSATAVLPLVLLGRAVARRTGRRDSRQLTLVTVAVVATALALLIGSCMLLADFGGPGDLLVYPVLALSLIVGLAPATLCARAAGNPGKPGARWRVLGGVALGGLGLLAVTLAVGAAAYGSGILKIYEPPRLTAADMVGTWTDGDGGSLRFEADGTVTAKGVNEYEATGEQSGASDCTGNWQLTENDGVDRPFELSIADCESLSSGWNIGGTEEHPTVFTWIGEPDSGERYILTRQR
ncbi:hypothetical protein SAMN05421870_101659 [Streptomyces qinglanensis]|uniref:Uncharacterized protein n=1 Tax=Streptomyces qinglanensis TaxID=943816 RepID=A0A1H9NTV1_9ACTN|nr:hypothetical protein SAMN05421870_101659 [Streptomyces qinglanensis]